MDRHNTLTRVGAGIAVSAEIEHIARTIGDQSWKSCIAFQLPVLVHLHAHAIDHDGLQVGLLHFRAEILARDLQGLPITAATGSAVWQVCGGRTLTCS